MGIAEELLEGRIEELETEVEDLEVRLARLRNVIAAQAKELHLYEDLCGRSIGGA